MGYLDFHEINIFIFGLYAIILYFRCLLKGFSKPGYPGIIIVEGLNDKVHEYISRLKVRKTCKV
jgi:hypothetical protein